MTEGLYVCSDLDLYDSEILYVFIIVDAGFRPRSTIEISLRGALAILQNKKYKVSGSRLPTGVVGAVGTPTLKSVEIMSYKHCKKRKGNARDYPDTCRLP